MNIENIKKYKYPLSVLKTAKGVFLSYFKIKVKYFLQSGRAGFLQQCGLPGNLVYVFRTKCSIQSGR